MSNLKSLDKDGAADKQGYLSHASCGQKCGTLNHLARYLLLIGDLNCFPDWERQTNKPSPINILHFLDENRGEYNIEREDEKSGFAEISRVLN